MAKQYKSDVEAVDALRNAHETLFKEVKKVIIPCLEEIQGAYQDTFPYSPERRRLSAGSL